MGLNHTSRPLAGQSARGQNGGKEGHNLATPINLSMVYSLGTQAERKGMQAQSNGTSHLNDTITTPIETRPNEEEAEEEVTTCSEPENIENYYQKPGFFIMF